MKGRVCLIGEYNPLFEPHAATQRAIEHSSKHLNIEIEARWLSTEDIDDEVSEYDGFWIAPGSPYKNLNKTLSAIRFAREKGVPCIGTCGGFQHMIIEYARNVLGFKDAQHAEYDPYASNLFVSELQCSLAGRDMQLSLKPDSMVARIYGSSSAVESYYCNFGVNPDAIPALSSGPLKITGSDAEGEVRVVELPGHPFVVGTLFVPQTRSKPNSPHPLVNAFLETTIALR